MKRVLVLLLLTTLLALGLSLPAQADTIVETYTDPAAFKARLAGAAFPVKIVNFDDIAGTTTTNAVFFSATRYRAVYGMVIAGEGGQYAGRGFRFSVDDFPAVSKYNVYAPGPVAWTGPYPIGGNETNVTFSAWGTRIRAAGFGCYFVDADYPEDGPAGFEVFDSSGVKIAQTGVVVTSDAGKAFRGIVTVDSITQMPVRGISRVWVLNGSGWPGNDNNEGVVLDNFMAGTATYRVAGKVVNRYGRPFKGVTVSLTRSGRTVTAVTSSLGAYTFRNVPAGVYTVLPKKTGYSFLPARRTPTVVNANVTLGLFKAR